MANTTVTTTLSAQDQIDFSQLGLDPVAVIKTAFDTVRKNASDQRVLYVNTLLTQAAPSNASALSMILRNATDNFFAQP